MGRSCRRTFTWRSPTQHDLTIIHGTLQLLTSQLLTFHNCCRNHRSACVSFMAVHVLAIAFSPATFVTRSRVMRMACWLLRSLVSVFALTFHVVHVPPSVNSFVLHGEFLLSSAGYSLAGVSHVPHSGMRAEWSERTERTCLGRHVPDHAASLVVPSVPFAAETCGYMGKQAELFVDELATTSLRVGAFPSVHPCRGQRSWCWFRCRGGMLGGNMEM